MAKSIRKHEAVEPVDRSRVVAIGVDLGDKSGTFYAIDNEGELVERGTVVLRMGKVEQWASQYPATVIAIEAGGHSPWVSRTLAQVGHDVAVANPARIPTISKNKRKSDQVDPELLARLARFDRKMLYEVHHRGEQAQRDLQMIRTRDVSVRARTKLVAHIRGTVKAYGQRIPSCSTESFVSKANKSLDSSLLETLEPVLRIIEELTAVIREYDRKIEQLVEVKYPEAKLLMQIRGVGALTALAYMLVIEDVHRFRESRTAGAYVGLVPARDQSGELDPQLGITKAGDRLLRRLLIQSAHYILGPHGVDCDLRRHGEAISSRGAKKAKRRAAVAVARKLAVLMHRLWLTSEVYDPLYNAKRHEARAAAELVSQPVSTATEVGLSL